MFFYSIALFSKIKQNRDRKTRTYVYVLIVEKLVKDYDDACKIGRLRRWFSIDDAFNMLSQHKPVQQEYIDKLCRDEVRGSNCNQTIIN